MSGGTRAGATGLFALALAACGFTTPGGGSVMTANLGDDDGSGGGSLDTATDAGDGADDSGPSVDGTTGATGDMTGVGSITSPTSDDTGPDETTTGVPSDETTTGDPPDPCENPPLQTFMMDVSEATLSPPMTTGTHSTFGMYAFSTTSSNGVVSFSFTTECQDTWRAWAFIYDQDPGFSTQTDPDSFSVWLDSNDPTLWIYGCQNDAIFPAPPQWSWQSVNDTGLCLLENSPIQFTLPGGPHLIHFRNVESGTAGNGGDDPGNVAAIAKVVVSNDPAFSP